MSKITLKSHIQSCNTTTERLGKRRARAAALIGGIVTTIVIVSPNKEDALFKSIRSQTGANKRQRCAIIVPFHADRKAITLIFQNRKGHFVLRIILFRTPQLARLWAHISSHKQSQSHYLLRRG